MLIAVIANAKTTIAQTVPTTNQLIMKYADQYDVSAVHMWRTLRCESGLRPDAIGDGGKSYGIAQIHLPSHPTVTKDQALDKEFAIEWMAQKFSEKKQRMWTCYRILKLGVET